MLITIIILIAFCAAIYEPDSGGLLIGIWILFLVIWFIFTNLGL